MTGLRARRALAPPTGGDRELLEAHGGYEDAIEQVERRLDLGLRLRALDERSQVVVALRFGLELSQAEIAERLGISQMHVSRLLRAALEQLWGDGADPRRPGRTPPRRCGRAARARSAPVCGAPSSAQIDPNVIHGRPGAGMTQRGVSRSASTRSQSAPVRTVRRAASSAASRVCESGAPSGARAGSRSPLRSGWLVWHRRPEPSSERTAPAAEHS